MNNLSFNGVPLLTYGLIGITTTLLAWSVFRDDASASASASDSVPASFASPIAEASPIQEPEPSQASEPATGALYGGKKKRTKRNKDKKSKKKTKSAHK